MNTANDKLEPKKHIGVFGGTFDPIHLGHTEPVKQVAEFLSLEKILFIPANIPVHKASPNISAAHRAEMVKLACEGNKHFRCDNRELQRQGDSYTVDTLKELQHDYPEQDLFFIIGLDSLLTFTTWHNPQEILSLCHLVVNTRPNYALTHANNDTKNLIHQHQLSDLSQLENQHHGGIIFMPQPADYNVSSTELRVELSLGTNQHPLIDDKVLAFINKNQLYR